MIDCLQKLKEETLYNKSVLENNEHVFMDNTACLELLNIILELIQKLESVKK